MPVAYLWLFPLGLVIGAFGTLIGAGGGFILVPILLIVYPDENTELITSISLAVVFFNALSGSFAYARMKRIDFKSGIVFAVATIPGAILGAISVAYVPRQVFDIVFGVIMIAAGAFLWLSAKEDHAHGSAKAAATNSSASTSKLTFRDFIDADGVRYQYAYNPAIGIVLSVFVGFVSSLLGVGGGFIHVPALSRLLNFPVHVATATSHFVLAVMALTGTIVHIVNGGFEHGVRRTAILAVGVLIGAQIGARLSNRIGGKSIIRGLALALVFVGLRLVWSELRLH
ncbi:MAG TPA: sulfite exporter TauE/SafE family protein [Candidatus Saccharimonadales bacterium]|nr:sulfite exporter TauE/SafE family protein [Candidatus Saccharimonadales bacterium]